MEKIFQAGSNYILAATYFCFFLFCGFQPQIFPIPLNYVWEQICLSVHFPFSLFSKFNNMLLSNLNLGTF